MADCDATAAGANLAMNRRANSMKSLVFAALAVATGAASCVAASPAPSPDLDPVFAGDVRTFTDASGLRVVLAAAPPNESVAARAFVGVYTPYGTDREVTPGLAHFSEHLYSNTPSGLDDHRYPDGMENFDSNAMTRPDYISVWSTVSADAAVQRALGRSGALWSRAAPDDLFARQQQRVIDELGRSIGSQSYAARRAVDHLFYANKPSFAVEVDNTRAFAAEEIDRHLDATYAPSTSVLVIAGEIDLDAVEADLRAKLDARPKRSRPTSAEVGAWVDAPRMRGEARTREVGSPDFEGVWFAAGFAAPPRASDDYIAMIVLDQLLLGGRGEYDELWNIERALDSPLGRRLATRLAISTLDDGRGYSSASPPLAEGDPAQFEIHFAVADGVLSDLDAALTAALAEVYAEDLTAEALNRAKLDLVDFYQRWLADASLRPLGDHLAGLAMHDAAGPARLATLHEDIESVTLSDVRSAMKRYLLNGDRRVAVARHDPTGVLPQP